MNSCSILDADDVVIDGGNSYYRDDMARATQLTERGLHYVDCGTSGGVWGLERGYSLMIGGEDDVVDAPRPDLSTIAPGEDGTATTPGRTRTDGTAPLGYLHCGPNGAGHFVKMVHNGIEYGMMAAIAEGLSILKHANVGTDDGRGRRRDDAAARSPVLRLRLRPRRGRRSLAPRLGRRVVAGRPHRRRARRARPELDEFCGTGVGLRRGSLDGRGRDRRVGARRR